MAAVNKSSSTNNKKRKQYLPHNKPAKKKGWYPLHPGVQGFFITCDGGRERQASHEALDVIDSYYEELVHGATPSVKISNLVEKPMNKKIVFDESYSGSDDDDDDDDDKKGKDGVVEKEEAAEKVESKPDDVGDGKDDEGKPVNEVPSDEIGEKAESLDQSKEEKNGDDKLSENQANGNEGPSVKKQCVEATVPKKVQQSVDRLIEAELEELGDRSKRRFVNLDPGCNGMAFVQMHKKDKDPSPKEIVQHMLTSLASSKKHVSRFILRLLPIEVSCYPSEEEISKAIVPLVERYFPLETETPRKFAVMYEARANTGVDRMKIINYVAKAVPSPHKVDLSNPDITILVQIVKTVCLIGVAEKYKELAKYNVRQLTSSDSSK